MTSYLADTPTLTTVRLTLRAPVLEDFDAAERFYATDRSEFVGGPCDQGQAWRIYGHVVGMWALKGFGMFVFCEKGSLAPLGLAGPWEPADWPEPEIGWSVWEPEAEGRGYAAEAALAARGFAYEVLGWPSAVSYVDASNTRSAALARRMGAVLDPDAPRPPTLSGDPIDVYRHPAPGGGQ
ncbi:MAG: GNAT family N-acetyltransferase [Pseudomonadota bacterium]